MTVGSYNPLSINIFNFSEFYWNTPDNEPPSNFRTPSDYDCPFPEEDIKDSEMGNIIAGMMILFIILLTLGSSTCLFQMYWKFGVVQLSSKVRMSFEDISLIFQMIVEGF